MPYLFLLIPALLAAALALLFLFLHRRSVHFLAPSVSLHEMHLVNHIPLVKEHAFDDYLTIDEGHEFTFFVPSMEDENFDALVVILIENDTDHEFGCKAEDVPYYFTLSLPPYHRALSVEAEFLTLTETIRVTLVCALPHTFFTGKVVHLSLEVEAFARKTLPPPSPLIHREGNVLYIGTKS